MEKKDLFLIVGIVIAVIVLLVILLPNVSLKKNILPTSSSNINSFEECVEAGFTVIDSNPKLCKTNTGQDFYGPWKTVPSRQFTCQVDDNCVPMPSECHPTQCINKEYESTYKTNKELACTLEFRPDAAYSAEDCACVENVCVNIRLAIDSLE